MHFLGKITGLVLMVLPFAVLSQDIKKTQDFGLWTGVGVEHKFNKNWEASLSQDFRFFDNVTRLNNAVSDVGLTYRINKNFKLGSNVRYTYSRKKSQNFTNDIRFSFDFKFKARITKSLAFKYRHRVQNNYINLFTYEDELKNKINSRHRIAFEYAYKKQLFFVSGEIFREYVYYKKPDFNNLRLVIGNKWKTKSGTLSYALAYERELDSSYPLNFIFLKTQYTFKL